MVMSWHRPATITVDRSAITFNIQQELQHLTNQEELFAVVKADGYGHGAVEMAKTAVAAGATGLCVSNIDEALELRKYGLCVPILVLGITDTKWAELAQKHTITLTVANLEWLRKAEKELHATYPPLKIHLKIDTGMHRIGFQSLTNFEEAVKTLKESPLFVYEGLFTHFATADEEDHTYFDKQVAVFKKFISVTDLPKYVHCANSATALWHQECHSNIVRFGIAMYGLNPSGDVLKLPYTLKPALSLVTEVVFEKQLLKGERVSYGVTYQASEDEWIGTLPIGYADGWSRFMQGFSVLVDGEKCEIVGRVCMDQCMIRLPKKVGVGTKVTLIGTDQQETISASEVASYMGTISYEVVCALAGRLARVYVD